ncbi:MAG: NADH-quinone oxidoreductase subunit M, partial [Deltaproteobacteria bacterium]|nr:NADH-quinone oxidoreductase subunit M [Deltaproteobacteria bacterium]
MDFPVLSLVTFLPMVGLPLVLLIPRRLPGTVKGLTLGIMLVTFLVSLKLYFGFDETEPGMQFVEDVPWIGTSIHYKVGVDGLSLLLVLLTTFLAPIAYLGAWNSIKEKVPEFAAALLVLQTAMVGTFLAMDLFLFYVFWELMLIPMYLIIGVWGGERRIYATIKFVLFTMAGSILMLVAILFMYFKSGGDTFDYSVWVSILTGEGTVGQLSKLEQVLCFLAFALAFAIKVPLFPLHTWLPDAHVEAPTTGSVILAGVLLKMGTYGFLRFAIPFFPDAAALLSAPLMGLSVIGIVYGALVAFAQEDVKKLVAYSSVSHLGFVMLGMFAMTPEGVSGSILQMVNHGLSTGALFLCVGFLYERRHTRLMEQFGGIARVMPAFAAVFVLVSLSSIGLPGTNGFVGEFLILSGVFREGIGSVIEPGNLLSWRNLVLGLAAVATTGVVLGAVYMLTMVRRMMFGTIRVEENRSLRDLSLREYAVILPVLAFIVLIGIAPGLFLDKTRSSVDEYVRTWQPRMMRQRNEATAERNDEVRNQLIRMQVLNAMQGGGEARNLENLQWYV